MGLVEILVFIVVISVIWWAITYALTNLPLPAPVAQYGRVIATLIIVVVVVIFLLKLIGMGPGLNVHL